ncbi:peritrophin-1-like [Crassostrea angulata]|uniref:peritrophin-1-like n=1 Tax=Magallana angulata TaxID=2784310 RepID=UPI0022B09296|nr:peritrophin-1-like [Crassostrea angulata]
MMFSDGEMKFVLVACVLAIGLICSVEGQTKGCSHGSFSPHPSDCTMYQVCVHGYLLNMTCVYGTAWSQANSSCVDAATVNCTLQDDIKDSKSFSCPSTFGEFPDPKNCQNYYVCSFGRATQKQCQGNTGWDRKLKLCNYKYNLPNCS